MREKKFIVATILTDFQIDRLTDFWSFVPLSGNRTEEFALFLQRDLEI